MDLAKTILSVLVEATNKSNRFSLSLDLSQYPRGIYLVRVRSPAGVEKTGRVVVQ